jgi:hypothetical protein
MKSDFLQEEAEAAEESRRDWISAHSAFSCETVWNWLMEL